MKSSFTFDSQSISMLSMSWDWHHDLLTTSLSSRQHFDIACGVPHIPASEIHYCVKFIDPWPMQARPLSRSAVDMIMTQTQYIYHTNRDEPILPAKFLEK